MGDKEMLNGLEFRASAYDVYALLSLYIHWGLNPYFLLKMCLYTFLNFSSRRYS